MNNICPNCGEIIGQLCHCKNKPLYTMQTTEFIYKAPDRESHIMRIRVVYFGSSAVHMTMRYQRLKGARALMVVLPLKVSA